MRNPSECGDRAVGCLAVRQYGVVCRWQLLEIGVTPRSIERRLERGRLHRLHRGTYAVGHAGLSFHGRVLAAIGAMGPGSVASHETALELRGVDTGSRALVHATTARPRAPLSGVAVHRATIDEAESEIVGGIPCTSGARALLDLSATCSPKRLRRLLKSAEFERAVTWDSLRSTLARHPYLAGRRALAGLVLDPVLASGRTRSELEDRFLSFLSSRYLPAPETNVTLVARGRPFEVDCLWRDARLIVELDGARAHATSMAFEDDRARDIALVASGYVVLRVTWNHLHDHPDRLEVDLRETLGLP